MIFGKEYDSSLWLIMNGSKGNAKQISSFFRNVPMEFFEKVNESINEYKECMADKNLFDDCDRYFTGEYRTDNDVIFKYIIRNNGVLEIYEIFDRGDELINIGCLSLTPFVKERYSSMKNFKVASLGLKGHNFKIFEEDSFLSVLSLFCGNVTFYNIVKYPFGLMKVDTIGDKDNFKIVKLSDVPDNLNLEDFDKIKNSKKLVRKKAK